MPRTKRQYGKQVKRTKAERLFAELPQSPLRKQTVHQDHQPPVDKQDKENNDVDSDSDQVNCLTSQLLEVQLEESKMPGSVTAENDPGNREEGMDAVVPPDGPDGSAAPAVVNEQGVIHPEEEMIPDEDLDDIIDVLLERLKPLESPKVITVASSSSLSPPPPEEEESMRVLTWDDVCPAGATIQKIAEASYAEVYRVSNARGISIMKVIRLKSPIKALTSAQVRAGLVDEEPHGLEDVRGELRISEWLAPIPGFVVYKERYIVKGKKTKGLLETHQEFQKKLKKEDPDRAQFYPSPSRYLDDTEFMVVELGDAGTSLEDWKLCSGKQLWDIFFLVALALARAEKLVKFEHRDLHESNLCIKRLKPEDRKSPAGAPYFGRSGLEITILDYGLSRAQDVEIVACDLDADMSLFTSNHAGHCNVYRQMRSWVADHRLLPPTDQDKDAKPEEGAEEPVNWKGYHPFTNVLWLRYIYDFLLEHFCGPRFELIEFKKITAELRRGLNTPASGQDPVCPNANAVVLYALSAGWMTQEQLSGITEASGMGRGEQSIILEAEERPDEA